jgi:hypothetical protein
MIQSKPSEDFQTLVDKIDPQARLVRMFSRGISYQWQDWFERFMVRLRIEPNSPLPAKPDRWVVFRILAESKSQAAFRSALKEIPREAHEWIYDSDIGQKLRAWETTRPTDEEFERLRASAKEIISELRARKDRLNGEPEESERETIEEFGLVLRPASSKLLAKKLILSGIEVEKVSDEHKDIGLAAGDIIIDYDRVYDLVMGWHSFNWRTRDLANKMKRGYRLRIIRADQVINLVVNDKQ